MITVMIDRDLAALYHVETKVLNQAVRRNIKRFPEDFMFQLSSEELVNWKSQFVTSNLLNKGLRKKPLVFSEQGIAMLSSVYILVKCHHGIPLHHGIGNHNGRDRGWEFGCFGVLFQHERVSVCHEQLLRIGDLEMEVRTVGVA